MKKITLLILALFSFSFGFSQTFTDSGGPYDIQNGNGTTALTCGTADELNLPLAVTGVGTLGGVNSIESVTINVTHTWNSDVKVSLQDPSGTLTQLLVENIGGSGDDFVNCVLIDSGSPLPTTTTTPVSGSFAPLNPLSAFNSASTLADGNWTLVVCDDAGGDVGTVDSWSITFVPTPTGTLDYYNLQWPPNGTISVGDTFNVYAQAYEAGLTDVTSGQSPGIASWIGYSSTDTDPSGVDWTWFSADFNVEAGNNDEYTLNLGPIIPASGTFYYASRWSLEGGPYTYGGILSDGSNGGTWGENNYGSGILTINPLANDECTGALPLTESADPSCANAVSGTTVTAGPSASGTCSTTGKDVWYMFTPSQTASYIFKVTETQDFGFSSTYVSVYSGSCGATTQVGTGCSNTTVTAALTAATQYYVVVRSTSSTTAVNFDLCAFPAPPPPANDDCPDAIALTVNTDLSCGSVTSGTTVSATASPQVDDVSGTPNNDVWFSFVAASTAHQVSLTNIVAVVGTSVDMGIGVYDGTGGCDALIFTATSDPDTLDITGLTVGVTYYIRVYGWGSTATTAQTTFDICVGTPPPPPANDECAGALPLIESADSSCANAVSGTTVSANPSASGTCSASGKDVWYTFTPSQTASYVFNVTETEDFGSSSTYVSVYSGSCGSTTQVGTGCFSSTATLALTSATQYYVVVRSSSSTAGVNFDLCAYPAPPPPANDACTNAIGLTPGMTYSDNPEDGTVLSATADAEAAGCGLNGPGVWYSVVAPNDGNLTIETGPDTATSTTGFDSVIEAFSGNCGALTSIDCDDDGASTGNYSQLTLTGLEPASTIYIRVWEYGGNESEPFSISAYSATLSIADAEENSFTYFPNPVKNTLNLKAQSAIQDVSVYNMLGQEILRTAPNSLNSEVNMGSLQTGAYFVRVTINDATETIRVIKQ